MLNLSSFPLRPSFFVDPTCRTMPPPSPDTSLLPKHPTRTSALINHTHADGTGIVVAVLDTGVDPAAPGLQDTPNKARKVIDLVDCTGSGDVITTTIHKISPDATTLPGLSGRTLHLPASLRHTNPTHEYRLGLARAFTLFPSTLVSRLRKERRAAWDRAVRRALSHVRVRAAALRNSEHPNSHLLEELDTRQAVLLAAEKNYRDTGPVYDCVVFHDSVCWRAVVDTSETGNLSTCHILEDYARKGRYGQFGKGVMMNFAVNIYNDGDLLSVVVDGGSHGTHVAGILAANFPDAPHLNGLAPGAQIVSLKIGDSRLSSMETHQGTIRAMAYLLNHSSPVTTSHSSVASPAPAATKDTNSPTDKHGPTISGDSPSPDSDLLDDDVCSKSPTFSRRIPNNIDVVNMSFGEHSRDVNQGRFIDLVNRLVYKHNVMFLSSAGNEGPGLSSVSAPGGTTDAMIGVGAYVTPAMLTQAYSLLRSEFGQDSSSASLDPLDPSPTPNGNLDSAPRAEPQAGEPVVGIPYTWSSRGPVTDGAMGVSICAPGGAIAPVPLWMLQKKMLMNGTSMSSPSAAGAVAVILSFLKGRGIPYTSSLVRRAIENTARPLKPSTSGSELLGNARCTTESCDARARCKFDSEYYQDLVFAVGHGSIDALAACRYIERYMSRRKLPIAKSNVQEENPVETYSAPGHLENPSVVSSFPYSTVSKDEVHSPNGSIPTQERFSTTLEHCGDSSFHLEDWQVNVRVDDGTPSHRGPSNPGCGVLNATRGIYLRGAAETDAAYRASVFVKPVSHNDECAQVKEILSNMEVKIVLQCDAPWVEVPTSLLLHGAGRSFPVSVDPVGLKPGYAHFAEIVAHVQHENNDVPFSGPVFRVPITVHKPEALIDGLMVNPLRDVSFSPGAVLRRFYEAPFGATYALLKISTGKFSLSSHASSRSNASDAGSAVGFSELSSSPYSHVEDNENVSMLEKGSVSTSQRNHVGRADGKVDLLVKPLHPAKVSSKGYSKTPKPGGISGGLDERCFEAHVVQIGPQRHCGELESREYFVLRPGTVKECIIRIQGGSTLELCLAQMWSSPGLSLIERVDLIFGGVLPVPSTLHSSSGALCFPRVEVVSFLPSPTSKEMFVPLISGYVPRGILTHLQRTIVPSEVKIQALFDRDIMPESAAMFQLQLEYSFEVYDSSSSIKLLFPGLNRAVYEAEVDGGPYVTVHDKHNQFLFASDIYPQEQSLAKGTYSATAYIRHDFVDVLEKLKDLRVTVEYKLSPDISLDAYNSAHAACLGIDDRKAPRGTASLESSERRAFYFATPKHSSLPKWAVVGDLIVGYVHVDKLASACGNASRRGGELPSYDISFGVGPTSPSRVHDSKAVKEEEKPTTKATAAKKNSNTTNDTEVKDGDKAENASENGEQQSELQADLDQWFEEAFRKVKLKRMRTLLKERKLQMFDVLCVALREKYPDDVEILLLVLERVDYEACRIYRTEGVTKIYRQKVDEILKAADEIIKKLDSTAVATHFGVLIDPESPEECKQRKTFEGKRAQLAEASFRKTRALCNLVLVDKGYDNFEKEWKEVPVAADEENSSSEPKKEVDNEGEVKERRDAFEKAVKELLQWASIDGKGSLPNGNCSSEEGMGDGTSTNEDVTLLCAKREVYRGRLGFALKVIDNFFGSMGSKRCETEDIVILRENIVRKLGWDFLAERERSYRAVRFPKLRAPY